MTEITLNINLQHATYKLHFLKVIKCFCYNNYGNIVNKNKRLKRTDVLKVLEYNIYDQPELYNKISYMYTLLIPSKYTVVVARC